MQRSCSPCCSCSCSCSCSSGSSSSRRSSTVVVVVVVVVVAGVVIVVVVVVAHAQGTALWNMLVFRKHGLGWDVNVHVTLMMLRCSWGLGWGGVGC